MSAHRPARAEPCSRGLRGSSGRGPAAPARHHMIPGAVDKRRAFGPGDRIPPCGDPGDPGRNDCGRVRDASVS
eukprot:gene16015-biopygen6719